MGLFKKSKKSISSQNYKMFDLNKDSVNDIKNYIQNSIGKHIVPENNMLKNAHDIPVINRISVVDVKCILKDNDLFISLGFNLIDDLKVWYSLSTLIDNSGVIYISCPRLQEMLFSEKSITFRT